MHGLGTIINVIAIVIGGAFGIILKKGIPERFKNTIMQAIGLAVVIVGISGALQGIFTVTEQGKLDRNYITGMILYLVAGSLIGEALKIEEGLDRMGMWFQNRFAGKESNFAKGFVTASLVYVVGAMAIVGSLEDGLYGKIDILTAKAMLDGISAIVFSATLGIGVLFSGLSVLVYQGGITVLAGVLKPLLSDVVVSQMSLVGSVLILAIGLNLLEIKKFKVGNMLPAIFIPLIYSLFYNLIR
ncbi:MAG TPA: DUF554 domain-containing protein [Clostridiaceae bacterium]|jgi:uncharacterized membrane protein YqgA involved in biofilm formation|nr:DUF554 domain-containing protein [Clostridiaceae bacterium]